MTGPNIDWSKRVSMAPETHHCLLPQMHALQGLSDQIRALNFKIFTWEWHILSEVTVVSPFPTQWLHMMSWDFQLHCHFQQCPWDLGSAWAERAGQREVGGCTRRVQTAWLCLGSLVQKPWLALGGPFLFHLQALLPCRSSISSVYGPFFSYARLALPKLW